MTLEPERRSDDPVEAMSVTRLSSARRAGEIPIFFLVVIDFVM